jgi:hypothetical protein
VAKKRQRNQHLIVRVSVAEKLALNQAAVVQDVPASQLVRKAIKKVVSETASLSHENKPT